MKAQDFKKLTDLKKVNVAELDQLIRSMAGSPEAFNFGSWLSNTTQKWLDNGVYGDRKFVSQRPADMIHECGTKACVAGWAAALADTRSRVGQVSEYDLRVFIGIEHKLALKMSYDEDFYVGRRDYQPLTTAEALVQLRGLLKQALEAQDVELV